MKNKNVLSVSNWTDHLLKPQVDWYRKNCPVVKVTMTSPEGETLEARFARVSPVVTHFRENTQVVTLDYELDYEFSEKGTHGNTKDVQVAVLKAGGWENPSGIKHLIEFVGFTHDVRFEKKKWSYTY